MDDVKEISYEKAKHMLDQGAVFVDVRDPASFEAAHIPGAHYLSDANIEKFVKNTDKSQPIVAYCYHGHTSLGAAAYLMDQGFTEVYSLIGGFESWRHTGVIES
jgi:thiosulfate sulfurtransferase